MAKYLPTIGLEIHAQIKTKTKLFCDSLNNSFETRPNVNVCPVCMGHPGALPVVNKEAIKHVIRVGYALNSEIAINSKFDRKNYFYPDLPKGYQISQYDMPFCSGGYIDIESRGEHGEEYKRIEIERIHLEEDTGRLVHSDDGETSYVDFNRSSVPLMELVTKPVLKSSDEAIKFAEEFRLILRYLGASDADMERGQMRVEVNISLAEKNAKELGTKVELKNLNSLRVVQAATAYEIERQKNVLEKGDKVSQQTRGWDEVKQETFAQRSKEEAHDYRYFPEPDVPPIILSKDYGFDLEKIKASLPELPQAKRNRFVRQYKLKNEIIHILIQEHKLADFFENATSEALRWGLDKKVEDNDKIIESTTNYIIKNLRTLLSEKALTVEELKITPENFGELISSVVAGEISSAAARDVLLEMFETGKDPSDIIEEKGLKQVSDEGALVSIVEEVFKENEKAVSDYRAGEDSALKFLVGAVMTKSKGSANPQVAQELLKKKLLNQAK